MAKTHQVSFTAKKNVSKPVKVKFKTKAGQKVSFGAHKTVKKPTRVSFRAKTK